MNEFDVIRWNIGAENPITPADPLPPMPVIPPCSIVLLEGRAPIWRYGMAFHAVHGMAMAVATFDPRLGGGVVVASHHVAIKVGEVIN